MVVLKLTRNEMIRDLPKTYRENNDLTMSDKRLIAAWKRLGTHAGTWEWDHVVVED